MNRRRYAWIMLVVVAAFVWFAICANLARAEGEPFVPDAPTKFVDCKIVEGLPDHACTPGAVMSPAVSPEVLCNTEKKYHKGGKMVSYDVWARHVPNSLKKKVLAMYGIPWSEYARFEFDHVIPVIHGGGNLSANLFPQLWDDLDENHPGAHTKDIVEVYLHRKVCRLHTIEEQWAALWDAQRILATDWRAALPEAAAHSRHHKIRGISRDR